MELWLIWGEICRVMATICLITALAAATAAGILLAKEKLAGRLIREWKEKTGKRTGFLVLAALLVWILVLGQNAAAAEAPEDGETAGAGSTAGGIAVTGDPETEDRGDREAGKDAPINTEIALPEEPGREHSADPEETEKPAEQGESEEPADSEEPEPQDGSAPAIAIEMTGDVNRDDEGTVYCRADNAGVRVTASEEGEEEPGIETLKVSLTDIAGNVISKEAAGKKDLMAELAVSTEEAAALADGTIQVKAEAVDAEGNRSESGFSFILDKTAPVLTECRTYCCTGEEEHPAENGIVYEGTDLYYNDEKLVTRFVIEDGCPVTWEVSYSVSTAPDSGESTSKSLEGTGSEGNVVISEEGVYGDWRISGKDIAGNQLAPAEECDCTQDLEDLCGEGDGIRSSRRKVLDRTAPVGEICIRSAAAGYFYRQENTPSAYYAADVEAVLNVTDRCAEAEMPVDQESYGLVVRFAEEFPEEGGPQAADSRKEPGEPYYLRSDGMAQFGAFGCDRAGNPLTVAAKFKSGIHVREELSAEPDGWILKEEYAAGPLCEEQGKEEDCAFCFTAVRDTVSPTLSVSINRPAGNPYCEDSRNNIIYYSAIPEYYGNGKAEISALFTVTDRHIAEEDLTVMRSYGEAPEGGTGGAALCEWKREDDAEITRDPDETERVYVLMTLHPGKSDTPDGIYRLGIRGRDKAGNPLTPADGEKEDALYGVIGENAEDGFYATGEKVVDTRAPAGEILVTNGMGTTYCRMKETGRKWETDRSGFMPFRREKKALILCRAEDISPVSVSCRVLSTRGQKNGKAPDGTDFRFMCNERTGISGEQIFRIEGAVFRDRAGNRSAVLGRTVNFYLDIRSPGTDIKAPSASARVVSQSAGKAQSGRPLYGGAVTLEVTAEDPERLKGGSGLKEVCYSVKIGGETVRDSVLLYRAQEPSADPSGEKEPLYRFSAKITIPAGGRWESNDIEVTVTAEDNAGNRSDPAAGGVYRFGIDTQAPAVTVSFDNNDVRNGRYFDRERTARIEVTDRNFSVSRMQVSAPEAETGEWTRESGKEAAGDGDTWVMEVRFPADGNYTLDASGADEAGNLASVQYTGEAPRIFTVDSTPPLIEVSWDNNDVRNGKYYNRSRRAAIRITELSFDERLVSMLPYFKGFYEIGAGERGGGRAAPVYETEISFAEDGEWKLSCACEDLAGNRAVPVSGPSFVIDTVAPRLWFDRGTVEEMGIYKEEIRPAMCWEEENPAPGSFCAAWCNRTAGESVTAVRNIEAQGREGRIELPQAPWEREADGLCVLSGTACDLAGNRSYIRRNLCVNRFGSLYDLSEEEDTMAILENYYTDASTPFVVAEYSLLPLVSRQITLYRNGTGRVLLENEEYSVTEIPGPAGTKYVYRIEPAAFREEGVYSLLLQSEDEAGGISLSPGRFRAGLRGAGTEDESLSGASQRSRDFSPVWAVDRTPPTVRITGADPAKQRYVADSVPVRLVPSDNMELKTLIVKITDDRGNTIEEQRMGEEALGEILDRNLGEVPVELKENEKWQTLCVTAIDGAGNRSSGLTGIEGEERFRVLISSNLLIHLYRSGILPAAAFLALIALIRYGYGVYKHTLA